MSDEKKPLHVEAIASATTRVENRGSMISLQLLLAVNAALMFLVLLGGYTAYQDLTMKYNEVQHIIRQPELVGSYVEVVMQEAVSSFIFGAVNGSLANFAYNMFRPELYATTAEDVAQLAASVLSGFANSSTVCPTIQCIQGNIEAQCSNFNVVWCEYAGQILSCNGETCVGKYVTSIASLIQSVAVNIASLTTPHPQEQSSSNSQAAFNTGLLNVEGLIPWARRQTIPVEWSKAGQRCLELASAVRRVAWEGTYMDNQGNTRVYNVNKHVETVVGYVEQVCSQVAEIAAS